MLLQILTKTSAFPEDILFGECWFERMQNMKLFLQNKQVHNLTYLKTNFNLIEILMDLERKDSAFLQLTDCYLVNLGNKEINTHYRRIFEDGNQEVDIFEDDAEIFKHIEYSLNELGLNPDVYHRLIYRIFAVYHFSQLTPYENPIDTEIIKKTYNTFYAGEKMKQETIELISDKCFIAYNSSQQSDDSLKIITRKLINTGKDRINIIIKDGPHIIFEFPLLNGEFVYVNTIDGMFVKILPSLFMGKSDCIYRKNLRSELFVLQNIANKNMCSEINDNYICAAMSENNGFIAINETGRALCLGEFGNGSDFATRINIDYFNEKMVDCALHDGDYIFLTQEGEIRSSIEKIHCLSGYIAVDFTSDGEALLTTADNSSFLAKQMRKKAELAKKYSNEDVSFEYSENNSGILVRTTNGVTFFDKTEK